MPTAKWLTPPTLAGGIADYAPEPEPRGLLGFMGGGQDFGADVGDRLGVIGQILMNLGSGRGGVGIAEASGAADARSLRRREQRKAERMVNRLADKIEDRDPEMAATMRANTEFGMRMLGKMYESEWDSTHRMAELNKQYELEGSNQIALANRKAELEAQSLQNTLRMAGLSASPVAAPDAGVTMPPLTPGAGPVLPSTDEMGAGIGTEPAPAVATEQPSAAQPNIPPEYLANLPPGQIGQVVLRQRLMHQDPEIGVDEVNAYLMAMTSQNEAGRQKYFDNINKRKEVQARVREFGAGANEMARQNQALPGINLQTPGQPELMQARIPLESVPPEQQEQTAEYLKQAVKEGTYEDALQRFLPKDDNGITLYDSQGNKTAQIGGSGSKGSEFQQKNDTFYDLAKFGENILSDQSTIDALTSGTDPLLGNLPPWAANRFTSNEYKNGVIVASNFIANLLRRFSGAEVKDTELERYWYIFIPTDGEGPQQVKLKRELRDTAIASIKKGRSPETVFQEAILEKQKKEKELSTGKPTTDTETPAPEADDLKNLLDLYPPSPAAGP